MAVTKRPRVKVNSLPFGIPNVPKFDGEETLDAQKEGLAFLKTFTNSIERQDWDAFGKLFAENCWWKDSLTLTFDKRTLHGRQDIVKAWNSLSTSRSPSAFTLSEDESMGMKIQFLRLAPNLATLDVPFSFSTKAPATECFGVLKLIPEDGQWKIWVLGTGARSLDSHPFGQLPRQSTGMIDASQRGIAKAHGLPRFQGVLDAVVIGAAVSGIANTIMLDSIGANVVAFDAELQAGGNWSTSRYENVTLHHPAFMIQLPMYPVPKEGYPEYLAGTDLTRYFSSAVENLKLPVFNGVKVLGNTFDEEANVWHVRVQDVQTKEELIVDARNIVISTGFVVGEDNPHYPEMADRQLFKGPVQHTHEYRTPEPYKNKEVVVVGSGNSAHDVASNLALRGAKKVTILQRGPTVLLDFEAIAPMILRRYNGKMPVDGADFAESMMPIGIMRDMAKGMFQGVIASQPERNAAFESKGYMLDKNPCMISRLYEERGRSFYIDQPKTFDLVFNDQIKIARGEVQQFVEDGIVVQDKTTGEKKTLHADGVVLATGYKAVDLPKKYAESGFMDAKSASMLENVSLFGVDAEGEVPGFLTMSGHPHVYFSGMGFPMARWISRFTAIQIMADIKGEFPERYSR